MKYRMPIISGVLGLVLGALAGYFFLANSIRTQAAVLTESGNYCCTGVDIGAKCEKQTAVCPADKPILVSVP